MLPRSAPGSALLVRQSGEAKKRSEVRQSEARQRGARGRGEVTRDAEGCEVSPEYDVKGCEVGAELRCERGTRSRNAFLYGGCEVNTRIIYLMRRWMFRSFAIS